VVDERQDLLTLHGRLTCAFVSYAGGQTGGVRAIEHLAHVFVETESVPVRNSVVIPNVREAFDADGQPKNPIMNAAADIMLDDLAWWSAVLEQARAGGELQPGTFRLRAALAPAS
jgi:NAD(P)H-dependent FMN reductase